MRTTALHGISTLVQRALALMVALSVLVAWSTAQAEMTATPLPGDARLVTFDVDPDNTYLILTKPKAVTHLEFPESEVILTIAAGDSANWELTPTQNRRHLFVKPKLEQMNTSMTVLTDKRSYQFVLRSTSDGQKWYQRVTWRTPITLMLDGPQVGGPAVQLQPADAQASPSPARAPAVAPMPDGVEAGSVRPEELKFDYAITGDAPFRPVQVFDNDRMTWVRLPPNVQELPVVLAVDTGGEFVLVNYVVRNDLLLVQRIMDRFILKIGRTEVRVTRGQQQRSWWGGRGTSMWGSQSSPSTSAY